MNETLATYKYAIKDVSFDSYKDRFISSASSQGFHWGDETVDSALLFSTATEAEKAISLRNELLGVGPQERYIVVPVIVRISSIPVTTYETKEVRQLA